jgi:tetratricopeptide (TPR) repeat protein
MSTPHPPLRDSYEGLYNRARSLAQAGDLDQASELYRRLVDRLGRLSDRILARRPELHDLHGQARLEFTSLLAAEARYAEAIEVEQVLLETHPGESNQWRRDLAVLRAAKGDIEAGLSELQTLAQESPDEPGPWIILGIENRLAGRLSESQAALNHALEACGKGDADSLADAHYQRFLLFREMKQLDDAVAAWEEAIKQNPEIGSTVREVYTMLTESGRYSDAQHYIARDENALQAGFQQGLIASLTGRSIDARDAWRRVAALDPDKFEYGHDTWVEAVLRLGDPEPALLWLQDSLPEYASPRLFVLSGIAWAMREDPELASVLFQQAINLMRRERPVKQRLDGTDWRLLDSLVADDETKATLKPYFAVVETLWG